LLEKANNVETKYDFPFFLYQVETIDSMIKRKMGDCVRARKVLNQNREVLFMIMVYNIERRMNYYFFIVIGSLESQLVDKIKYQNK